MKIAIDIDGVIGDQVDPVLKRIKRNYGVTMDYFDVQSWAEPIPNTNTDIHKEIKKAEKDQEYVLEMPTIDGAVSTISKLESEGHEICIVTGRPEAIADLSKKWIEGLNFASNEFYCTDGKSKSDIDADVIIDDRNDHVVEFVESGDERYGIIFSRPWNSIEVEKANISPSIKFTHRWSEIPIFIRSFEKS